MTAAVKFNCFVQDCGRKVHNLNSDTLKLAFTNTAPVAATSAVLADITQITAANGYSSGGPTVASTAYSQTSGTGNLSGTDNVLTASGGSVGPFRYVVLYNSTASGGPLICYWDYGAALTITDTNTFTTDFGATIATLA